VVDAEAQVEEGPEIQEIWETAFREFGIEAKDLFPDCPGDCWAATTWRSPVHVREETAGAAQDDG